MSGSHTQKGQAVLIVVLVMVVALTVGLSIVFQTMVDVRNSSDEDFSSRALSAAEAGIEEALKSGRGVTSITPLGNAGFIQSSSVLPIQGTEIVVHGGYSVRKDDGANIWLVPHVTIDDIPNPVYQSPWTGQLTIHWGTSATECENPALEIIIVRTTDVSNPTANLEVRRMAYDPCTSRRSGNSFSIPLGASTVGGISFRYRTDPIVITQGLVIRVIPIYKESQIGARVVGAGSLPAQAQRIEATGSSNTLQRKVTVIRGFPELPSEFFPYVLFSP